MGCCVGLFVFPFTDMPCLVEYEDGLWYRGKVVSTEEFNLDKIVVQFVDYGSFSIVPASR